MSGTRKDGLASKRIDQNTEQGKALQQVIQAKLKDYLGADYADDVLPLYIVVMLSHGNQAELMADNLEAFLGQAHAELFVKWCAKRPIIASMPYRLQQADREAKCISTCRLFQHLAEVGDKYAAPDQEGSRSSASTSVDGTSADEPGSEDGEASAMEQDNIQSRLAHLLADNEAASCPKAGSTRLVFTPSSQHLYLMAPQCRPKPRGTAAQWTCYARGIRARHWVTQSGGQATRC